LIFDVHEIYPAEFAESRFPKNVRPIVVAGVRAAIRAMIPFADRIVLAKESASPDYSGTEPKQILVQNFTSVEAAGDEPDRGRTQRRCGDRLKAVHLGGMSVERGWPQLLEALKHPSLDNVDVLLLGGFPSGGQEAFEAAVVRAGLAGRFEIVP